MAASQREHAAGVGRSALSPGGALSPGDALSPGGALGPGGAPSPGDALGPGGALSPADALGPGGALRPGGRAQQESGVARSGETPAWRDRASRARDAPDASPDLRLGEGPCGRGAPPRRAEDRVPSTAEVCARPGDPPRGGPGWVCPPPAPGDAGGPSAPSFSDDLESRGGGGGGCPSRCGRGPEEQGAEVSRVRNLTWSPVRRKQAHRVPEASAGPPSAPIAGTPGPGRQPGLLVGAQPLRHIVTEGPKDVLDVPLPDSPSASQPRPIHRALPRPRPESGPPRPGGWGGVTGSPPTLTGSRGVTSTGPVHAGKGGQIAHRPPAAHCSGPVRAHLRAC
ncbi:translation initiation factor IF-2-like [Leopardus geoffroyi]|uniref:translation initiation factor IF-2-like n=1 Tax=Leopardus geoffroyi TaxID=46844 RepID=UPI001E263BD4|nr:translation initiation factor IF-2-like [Leopardus geoffroyi]